MIIDKAVGSTVGQLAAAASNAACEINDRLLVLRSAAYNLYDYRLPPPHIIYYFGGLCYRLSAYRLLISFITFIAYLIYSFSNGIFNKQSIGENGVIVDYDYSRRE